MKTIALVSAEIVAVVATIGLVLLLLLVFRNPLRPAWLKKGGAEAAAATAIVAMLSFSMAFLIAGLARAGVDALVAMAFAIALAGGAWWGLWRLFAIGERLRRADAGQSPFHKLETVAGSRLGRRKAA